MPNSESKSTRLLVITDSDADYNTIRAILEPAGFILDRYKSNYNLYSHLVYPYKMVIFDMGENVDLSLDIIESIKQGPAKSIPLLAYAKAIDSNSLVNALNSGADDYLIKPFSEREFLARVRSLQRYSL